MMRADMLLSVLFVSGALACGKQASVVIIGPKKMEALNGSCLQIPCSFRTESEFDSSSFRAKSEQKFDSSRETFGVWIKSDSRFGEDRNNIIFNSSELKSTYPMRLTGKLTEKNCTTLFSSLITSYTDTYFFRIENGPFAATASCDPVRITVNDSPQHPSIKISGDLKEKESVTITCSAVTPCPHSPPQLTWTLQQDSHNNIQENTDGTFTTQIQKTITLSDQHDGYNISCSARYPVNQGKDFKTAEETKTLSVSYAPKDTSVSISPSAGSWVKLTCSSRAKPPASFTWFKNSRDGPMNVAVGRVYRVNVTDERDYYCVATNHLGRQNSSESHQPIKGSASTSGAVVGGIIGIVVLICVVVAVWWLKSKRSTSEQTQGLTAEEPAVQKPARAAEKEDIHYGELDFTKQRPKPPSASVQDGRQQEETLYAQVKMSKTANRLTQAADGTESVYAQVRKN